jgi:hypothetical protein
VKVMAISLPSRSTNQPAAPSFRMFIWIWPLGVAAAHSLLCGPRLTAWSLTLVTDVSQALRSYPDT